MSLESLYRLTCLCGRQLETPTRETLCECGRWLVLEWGADPVVIEGSSKKEPAECEPQPS